MKAVALKRSDRLQTQVVVIAWVTVWTLFCLIPLFITIELPNLYPIISIMLVILIMGIILTKRYEKTDRRV